MPRLIRFYVKTAFGWLVVAIALKTVALSAWGASLPALTPVSWHAFFVGWLTQLIFGIAHWMLPTIVGAPKARLRGNERLIWAVYVLLNVGLLVRAIAEPMVTMELGGMFWRWLLVASAWLQWVAVVFFVINSWARVRPPIKRGQRG